SLDSAEQFYDQENNRYRKPINIEVKINGTKHQNGTVVIADNCSGMKNLEKVVQTIGNSDKKTNQWTNGQFGYGIYSFMAACQNLDITSKYINCEAYKISINREDFDIDDVSDLQFDDLEPVNYENNTGTKVVLSGFEKEMWKGIDVDVLSGEIETHFELLLLRGNLSITFSNKGVVTLCKSYDYQRFEAYEFKKTLKQLETSKGKKSPQLFTIDLETPIKINLKLTEKEKLDKPPIFIKSGRRIAAVKDVKSFRTKHRSDIWGHPRLTGYIDLGTFLEPTIARTDFKNTYKSKAVFNALFDIEREILEFISDVNKQQDQRHYRALEDHLNKALSKLAKQDLMSYRTEYGSGNSTNLAGGGTGNKELVEGVGSKDRGDGTIENPGGNLIGENDGEGLGYQETDKNTDVPGMNNGDGASDKENDNPWEDSDFKGDEKKKSGFNINIKTSFCPQKENGDLVRSDLIGGTIEIYAQHPDFETRVNKSRVGEKRISQRLITYIAGEITVHYKDKLQTRSGQPEYDKKMFENLVEFIYKFEDLLKDLNGKNLADVSE
ncbi:ATP-binding protein, partial [Flavobacteriales bacterium]|nr:ATP-binding protein [Flavobacteriales bacterium]